MNLIELQAIAKVWSLCAQSFEKGEASTQQLDEADVQLEAALIAANVMNAEDAIEMMDMTQRWPKAVNPVECVRIEFESGLVLEIPVEF